MNYKSCAIVMTFLCLAPTRAVSQTGDTFSKEVITVSQVSGIEIRRIAKLPKAPVYEGEQELCENRVAKIETVEGKGVEQQGWIVTGEAKLGSLNVVSFVGRMEQGTSGSCLSEDGNLAFFANGDLVALAYMSKNSDLSIGGVEQRGEELRLLSGDWLQQSIADVSLVHDQGVIISALPREEQFCTGKVTVPDIRQVPIILAREMLRNRGWNPVKSDEEPDGRTGELRALGIKEADGCSGTGFGFCGFEYKNGDDHLAITTVGDSPATPAVLWYEVNCAD